MTEEEPYVGEYCEARDHYVPSDTMWPGFDDCQECASEPETPEAGEEWCEVGEHYVPSSTMWPDFADCQECDDEEKYVEYMLE